MTKHKCTICNYTYDTEKVEHSGIKTGTVHDDLTPKEQVLNAQEHLGTEKSEIAKDIANGGHIGLFMGRKPLLENWPKIARWIKEHSGI